MKKFAFLSVLFIVFGCSGSVKRASTELGAWKYSDLRAIDPADFANPNQDIIAVYSRDQEGAFQIRIDFLDQNPDDLPFLMIGFDNGLGGTTRLPLGLESKTRWDLLLLLPPDGNVLVLDSDFRAVINPKVTIFRDPILAAIIIGINKGSVNLNLDTTQVQKAAIRQELESISNNRVLLLNDRRRFELRVPIRTTCKVSRNRNESGYEYNTRDISFSGLEMEDLPGNWQKEDISIEIRFPGNSTTYSLNGLIQWRKGSKAGLQIDGNSPNYLQYCNELKKIIKSKRFVSSDLFAIQQGSLEQLFNIGQSTHLEPIRRIQ